MAGKNAFYAQSGGVTAVINASACAVLQTARQHSGEIGKVYAGRDGIIGALTEDSEAAATGGLRIKRMLAPVVDTYALAAVSA
jgi:6-phosphofructokinase 1